MSLTEKERKERNRIASAKWKKANPEKVKAAGVCLWSKAWKALEKDGLKKYSPTYFGQVQIYMHYLKLKSCLFTAVNADTMELQHLVVNYDGLEAGLIMAKICRVFDATHLGELLPRVTADPAFYLCSYCPFRKPCWG